MHCYASHLYRCIVYHLSHCPILLQFILQEIVSLGRYCLLTHWLDPLLLLIGSFSLSARTGDFHDEPGRNATSNKANANDNRDECETCGDSESVCSGDHLPPLRNFQSYKHGKFFYYVSFLTHLLHCPPLKLGSVIVWVPKH